MPGTKRRYRMTVGGRPPAKRFKGTVAAVSMRRGPTARRLASMGIETKFIDTGLVSSALAGAATTINGEQDPTTLNTISAIAIGDTESSRDGRTCTLKSVQVKGVIREPFLEGVTSPLNENGYFVAVVLDTQSNGAQLNSEDVFDNPSGSNIVTDQPMRNLQFINRFIVLWSKSFTRPARDGTVTNLPTAEYNASGVTFSMYKKLNVPVHFTLTTAAMAAIADNSLHVISWCRISAVLAPEISYSARVRFVG